MNDGERGSTYLEDLRNFLDFQKNLWGALAGISVFFPLSSALVGVIPLSAYESGGVFDQISPALVTILTTVVTLFVVLLTFAGRRTRRNSGTRAAMQRSAIRWFGLALAVLVGYLVLHQTYAQYAWDPWGLGSGDPRKLLFEIPLMFLYAGFFALLTRAFMLLGMMEFYLSSRRR
jgi:hypothetical protein